MNRCKKALVLLLTAVMLFSVSACSRPGGETPADGTQATEDYTVRVLSQVGSPVSSAFVYVYADREMKNPIQIGLTGQSGEFRFSMPALEEYTVALRNTPVGTQTKASYTFSGNTAEIRLEVSMEPAAGASLGLGDVMPDLTVVTSDGDTLTLSQLLQEKKMVMLNFWFENCGFCVAEFPYMEQAYQQYKEDIEIIALDPLDKEAVIAPFKAKHGLSFPMASCDGTLADSFGVIYYPTSVVIDRDGVIRLIGTGGVDDPAAFAACFAHFTGEDYDTMYYSSIEEAAYDYEKNKK